MNTASPRPPRRFRLTVGRLLLLVAVLSACTPFLVRALRARRIRNNEAGIIASLRTLCTSEAAFQSSTLADADNDACGEFGFLGELCGLHAPRGQPVPAAPAFFTTGFGDHLERLGGTALWRGYYLRVYLPTAKGVALGETGKQAVATAADANLQEVFFAVYAWPVELGETGERAFVVTQEFRVFATRNVGCQNYGGLSNAPPPEAKPAENPAPEPEVPAEAPLAQSKAG